MRIRNLNIIFKKGSKLFLRLILGFLVLLLCLWIAIQFEPVQNIIVDKVTNSLSSSFGTEVKVDRVNFKLFKSLEVEGLYIEDQQKDTLLSIKKLSASIGLFSLMGREIKLEEIRIDQLQTKLYNNPNDSTFNFQHIQDAFGTSEATASSDTTGTNPWQISFGDILLNDVGLVYLDSISNISLITNFDKLFIATETIDLQNQQIDVSELQLSNPEVNFEFFSSKNNVNSDPSSQLKFPYAGWNFDVQDVELANAKIRYWRRDTPNVEQHFDPQHLNFENLNLTVDKFSWDSTHLHLDLNDLELEEGSGLIVEKAELKYKMDLENIHVSEFAFSTPNSEVSNQTHLKFTTWNALNDYFSKVSTQVAFQETYLSPEDITLFAPFIPEDYIVKEPLNLTGNFILKEGNLNLEQAKINLGEIVRGEVEGRIENLVNPNSLFYDLDIQSIEVDYQRLRKTLPVLNLPSTVDSLGVLSMQGRFKGNQSRVSFSNLNFKTERQTKIQADGELSNLENPDKLSFNLLIDQFNTKAEDITYFSTRPLPKELYKFEEIIYRGKISGNPNKIYTKGNLSTAIGALESDLEIEFNSDYSTADYRGDLALEKFDLGVFLEDTLGFGIVDLQVSFDGSGLNPDSLKAKLVSKINVLEFNDYSYQAIDLNGDIKGLQFLGAAAIQDPNLDFNFRGKLDMNPAKPIFDFKLDLDTLDLLALNFSDQAIRLSGVINSNFTASSIDDFIGKTSLHNFYLSNNQQAYFLDSLLIQAHEISNRSRELSVNSELINAQVEGEFKLLDLIPALQKYINNHFPIDQLVFLDNPAEGFASEASSGNYFPEQNFRYSINIFNPKPLINLFDPNLNALDSIEIKGSFNYSKQDLELSLFSPEIDYDGLILDSLIWQSRGDSTQLNNQFHLASFTSGQSTFKNIDWEHTFEDDEYQTALSIDNANASSILEWGATLFQQNDLFKLTLNDSLMVDQKLWLLSDAHKILFKDDYISISNFTLNKEGQAVSIQTDDTENNIDKTAISLGFENFDLAEISTLTNIDGFDYRGLLNGFFALNDISEDLHYLADLKVNDFIVNDSLIGDIALTSKKIPTKDEIEFSMELAGENRNLSSVGNYKPAQREINFSMEIEKIPMILLDPFSLGAIKNSEGNISGQLAVKGSVDQPEVGGSILFQDATTTINYLQTRYTIPNGRIRVDQKRIDFAEIELKDALKNRAILSGYIIHDYFDDLQYYLDFATDKFRFLNTQNGANDLFYGRLNLSAQIKIRGTSDLPKVEVVARSLKDSHLTVSALLDEEGIKKADYILYNNPNDQETDSLITINYQDENAPQIDLILNLALTSDAELVIIVDPLTGDQLSCKGDADLTVRMFPSGDISVVGLYKVTSGVYQFNYQNLVKREFQIKEGSRLNFVGDPFSTRFDLTAVYKARTSLYPLINNESTLSSSDIRIAKDLANVNVLLRMYGDLDEPQLAFDIDAPDNNSSTVSNLVEQKLTQLRDDEAELNKQVFGLLLLNSFVADQSASTGLSTAGENIALSSVSNLISNQLNKLSERYLDGVGLTFDLESYRAQIGDADQLETRTNLNVGLTRSLFNERLKVKVGGVVQVDNGAGDASGLSNIAGDFVLEYQLDRSGNYVLRVFQRSDYDAFDDSNTNRTGAGISFKKSFGN